MGVGEGNDMLGSMLVCGGSGGVGKQVILRLTQSSGAGARTELGKIQFQVFFVTLFGKNIDTSLFLPQTVC